MDGVYLFHWSHLLLHSIVPEMVYKTTTVRTESLDVAMEKLTQIGKKHNAFKIHRFYIMLEEEETLTV